MTSALMQTPETFDRAAEMAVCHNAFNNKNDPVYLDSIPRPGYYSRTGVRIVDRCKVGTDPVNGAACFKIRIFDSLAPALDGIKTETAEQMDCYYRDFFAEIRT